MINLLPVDKKAEIRAARTNLILVRYIIILILALLFVLASMYVTTTILSLTKDSSEKTIASNDVKADIYSSTQAQVSALSASLSGAKALLDEEVRYSKVFVNIAQIMPANTVFGKLELTGSSFNGAPISVKVYAKTSADAVTLRQNFEKSPMFSDVNFQTIVPSGSEIDAYPVSVDMTFKINRTAAQ